MSASLQDTLCLEYWPAQMLEETQSLLTLPRHTGKLFFWCDCWDTTGFPILASLTRSFSRRLSPGFQNVINDLQVVHTSKRMIEHVRGVGGFVRRTPVESNHPLVRVHPVTGERSIWVNSEFVTGIQGFKETESDLLLKFLVDHVVKGHDFQARVSWEKHSVVMFDGRNTLRAWFPGIDFLEKEKLI